MTGEDLAGTSAELGPGEEHLFMCVRCGVIYASAIALRNTCCAGSPLMPLMLRDGELVTAARASLETWMLENAPKLRSPLLDPPPPHRLVAGPKRRRYES